MEVSLAYTEKGGEADDDECEGDEAGEEALDETFLEME
jgi:hypothetical protein